MGSYRIKESHYKEKKRKETIISILQCIKGHLGKKIYVMYGDSINEKFLDNLCTEIKIKSFINTLNLTSYVRMSTFLF